MLNQTDNRMEQLNKVELIGVVGSVKINKMGDALCARLSVVTNFAYKDRNGGAIVETTWHNVVAFDGKDKDCLEDIQKGMTVNVVGRLRNVRFIGVDGEDRTVTEILANKLKIVDS